MVSMLSGSFVLPVRKQLAYVGCSVGLFKVPVEVDQKPMVPRCSNLAAIQMGNSLDFVALRAEINYGTASSFAYADG
jgi:hypothetical protein